MNTVNVLVPFRAEGYRMPDEFGGNRITEQGRLHFVPSGLSVVEQWIVTDDLLAEIEASDEIVLLEVIE